MNIIICPNCGTDHTERGLLAAEITCRCGHRFAPDLMTRFIEKGRAFLALYSELHGDDLAETDEEVALADACNEFGDALDALDALAAAAPKE